MVRGRFHAAKLETVQALSNEIGGPDCMRLKLKIKWAESIVWQ